MSIDTSKLTPQLALKLKADLEAESRRRAIAKATVRPKTPDELHEWIKTVLGYRLARSVTTPGHKSPFDFLSDAYFEKQPILLAQGARGGGKTLLFAIHHLIQCIFKDNFSIVHIGGTELQSSDGYGYFAGDAAKYGKPGFIRCEPFNNLLTTEPMVSKTVLKNGSTVEIRTGGSEKSVSGPHPIVLAADELDHISMAVLNTALQMPMSRGGHRAMTIMGSSQYHSYGTLQALVSESQRRGITLYQFDMFDIMENCGRTYPTDCRECPLFMWVNPYSGNYEELCRGRGAQAAGHYTYNDMVAKFINTDTETFALQNLLMRGISQGMAFPQFSRAIHIKPFPPEGVDLSKWKCFAGVDQRTRGRIVVIAEAPGILSNGKRLRYVIAAWADDSSTPSRLRNAARELRSSILSEYGLMISTFWMESSASDEARDWKTEGLNGKIIPKEVRSVSYGLGLLRDAFLDAKGTPSLFVTSQEDSVVPLITAIADLYHYKRKPDGTFNRDEPDSDGEDWIDSLRYAYVGGAAQADVRLPEGQTFGQSGIEKYAKWSIGGY